MSVIQQPAPVAVLDRFSRILEVFEESSPLTLNQVSLRTGLPRSSTHRMLEQLVEKRWLNRSGRKYELGMRLVELGSSAVHQNRLRTHALPILTELQRVSGMVIHLGILEQSDVVYLCKIGGPYAAAVPTRVGGRRPASDTALGRALLAFGDSSTPHDDRPLRLRSEIEKIRDFGLAYESGSAVAGLNCIAAPIGPPNQAVAAVSVCGPRLRLKLDHHSAVPLLIAAAAIWDAVREDGRSHQRLWRLRTLRSMPGATGVWPTGQFGGVPVFD
ncbi:IclR family transcriptional regulator [Rhodococcus erythropolis]|nr:IclR family transcriptional regulator [Rhodococcus erythropolis]